MEAPNKDNKEDQQPPNSPAVGWTGTIEQQYRKIKENAEAYPYVWGSYIVVYGGFGLWLSYRWRKLRRTEDRVRVLQERLRKIVESKQSTGSVTAQKAPPPPPPSADKGTKSLLWINQGIYVEGERLDAHGNFDVVQRPYILSYYLTWNSTLQASLVRRWNAVETLISGRMGVNF
ncbi:hypothetical protein Vadar_011038 [Vaccinium darrowii]|uniref:Uncharacterized protein n=1 Tax=Vaccinium darrowii TaxID=229202 RepID=A0ACB7ZAG3_9ERIC|nr:hypothetical protein Vadar_011038 [Vaccinium darrowii]